jgi:polypeptide N-acetylgalactosaminyltransferase
MIIVFFPQGSRLDEYVASTAKFGGKVKVIRQDKRQGLMRSRMAGIRAAKAEILIFLDSHIEAGIGWIEPLLFRIQEDPKVIKRTLDKRQIKNVYLIYVLHTA